MSAKDKALQLEYNYTENYVRIRSKNPLNALGINPQHYKAEPEGAQFERILKFIIPQEFKERKSIFKVPFVVTQSGIITELPELRYTPSIEQTLDRQVRVIFAKEPSIEKSAINGSVPQLLIKVPAFRLISAQFRSDFHVLTEKIFSEVVMPETLQLTSQLKEVKTIFKEPQLAEAERILSEIPIAVPSESKLSATALEENENDEELREAYELDDIYESKFLGGFTKIFPDRPLIMVAKKNKDFEYIEFLKRVLREIYRVRVGGLPEPRHVSDKEDLIRPDPFEIGAGGRIFVVELTQELFNENDKDFKKTMNKLKDRLRELFSQGFGFLVFYGEEEMANQLVNKLWSIAFDRNKNDYLVSNFSSPLSFEAKDPELFFLIANLMWGKIKGSEDQIKNFDAYVVNLEDEFWKKLEELMNDFNLVTNVKPSSEPDEKDRESATHYLSKAFTVKYLINKIEDELEKKGYKEEDAKRSAIKCVETEHEVGDKRYDVFVNPLCGSSLSNLIVEIETLYGTGTIVHKLLDTIKSRLEGTNRLWIVIPNPEAMLYLPVLLKLRSFVRKESVNKEIEFYILDVQNNSLVTLTSVAKKILTGNGII